MAYGGNLHINKALTNVSIQYRNNEFIGSMIMKDIPVAKESDVYYIYAKDMRMAETLRANKSASKQITWGVSTTSYSLDEHAISDVVTDRDRKNADSPINMDIDATEFLTDKILMRQEKDFADLLFTTGTWSNNTTLTTATAWKYNTTTSAPIQNVLSATGLVIKQSGKRPNTLILNFEGFAALKENTNVYSRIQYVEKAIITEQLLASIFDVQNVYVGLGVYDAGMEGGTESLTSIWGPDALLAYFDPSATGLKKVTAGFNLRMSDSGNPYKVKKWREEKLSGDVIEVSTMFKPVAVATLCGYFFKTVALA